MPSSDQHVLRQEEGVRDATDQVPLQISVNSARISNAQAHAMIDAITAMVTNAQAGLNWLRAQPLNLEEVEQSLNSIARNGKRACKLVAQLRAAMTVPTQQGAPDSQAEVPKRPRRFALGWPSRSCQPPLCANGSHSSAVPSAN